MTKQQVAELASYIEISKMGMPIGKQDQYASAFGGLNKITFTSQGVTVEPVKIAPDVRWTLEKRFPRKPRSRFRPSWFLRRASPPWVIFWS